MLVAFCGGRETTWWYIEMFEGKPLGRFWRRRHRASGPVTRFCSRPRLVPMEATVIITSVSALPYRTLVLLALLLHNGPPLIQFIQHLAQSNSNVTIDKLASRFCYHRSC